jgi:uncharacterized iron-regulated membrane protein
MNNPLEFNYIFTAPREFGPYALTYFAVFTVGAIVSNLMYFWGKYRFKDNLLTYTMVNRASRNGAIAFTLGFLFCLSRVVQLQPFNVRLFMDIALVLLAFFVLRGILWLSRNYKKAKEEWNNIRAVRSTEKKATATAPAISPALVRAKPQVATATAGATTGSSRGVRLDKDADDDGDDEDDNDTSDSTIAPATPGRPLTPGEVSRRSMNRRERKRKAR